jgi:superfamily II DNA helicase RecQ
VCVASASVMTSTAVIIDSVLAYVVVALLSMQMFAIDEAHCVR